MKRQMGLWDIVWMNVTVVLGLRWIPVAATYGAAAIPLWIIAALFFFIPFAFISAELATAWPHEGGLCIWVKEAYGEKPSFLVSWYYWVNNFFWAPSILIFTAIAFAYVINPQLASHKIFINSLLLIVLWTTALVNCRNIQAVKWLNDLSGTLGTFLPGLLIIALGFASAFIWKNPIATPYSSVSNWIPNLGTGSSIAFLSTLMFSMAGIELTPVLAGETKNPQKTFPYAILISACLILFVYILGTVAISFISSPEKIQASTGLMNAIQIVTQTLKMSWLLPVISLMIIIGNIGGISTWGLLPVKMLLRSVKPGVLPPVLTQLNQQGAPAHAIILQSIIISLIIIINMLYPSINAFYETLILMCSTIYFIPYLFMFLTFLKLRKKYPDQIRPYRVPGGKIVAYGISLLGLSSVVLGIFLPFFVPPADINTAFHIMLYRLELIGGIILFTLLGLWIYRAKKN